MVFLRVCFLATFRSSDGGSQRSDDVDKEKTAPLLHNHGDLFRKTESSSIGKS